MGEVVRLKDSIEEQRMLEVIALAKEKKLKDYKGEFELFKSWCQRERKGLTFDSALKYLLSEIEVKQVRLNTFNRKVAALKFYLEEYMHLKATEKDHERISAMRNLYNYEPYLRKKAIKPVTYAMDKEEVLQLIEQYKTDEKQDIRIYAICMVNLITANRPSEMVRLKIKDFYLNRNEVMVLMIKQGDSKIKRLTQDCVNAVKRYIKEFDLQPDDYFVGTVERWGNYKSSQILENSYRQNMKRWLGGIAPYTLRKTQITSMHKHKADLATIARQSGHKSLQTIAAHYLDVQTEDLDEFI